MLDQINRVRPLSLEVGDRFINVSSIAYVEKVFEPPHGPVIYIYLNASSPDGRLQRIRILTEPEAIQIQEFINAHLAGYESKE